MTTDPRITQSAVAASDAEFQGFAESFMPTLLKTAHLLLRDPGLAEDAVQGTLLRVFRQWHEARNAPEAYSRVTLLSVCRDHWRSLQSRPKEVLTDNFDIGRPRDRGAFSDPWAERKELEEALARLGSPQREVLVLRFFLELSVSETAETLGIAEGTVKSSTSRGLNHLRGYLTSGEEVSAR